MKGKRERWLLTGYLLFLCLVTGIGYYFSQPTLTSQGKTNTDQRKHAFNNRTQTKAGIKVLAPSKAMLPKPLSVDQQGDSPKNTLLSSPNQKETFLKKTIMTVSTNQDTVIDKSLHPSSLTTTSKNKQLSTFHEIYKVPKGYCALTFDDGPSDYTEKIAQLLKNQHLPATFFFIGQNVKQRPKAVRFANSLGFKIGDHSYSHPQLTKLSETAQEKQILRTKKQIETIINKPVIYFRPPYGSFNNETKAILIKNHMQMVLWNNDLRDWSTKSPAVIVQRLSHSDLSGKVIILHDQKQTWEALPEILKVIKAKGLKVKVI